MAVRVRPGEPVLSSTKFYLFEPPKCINKYVGGSI
jgi:hypothetical protein